MFNPFITKRPYLLTYTGLWASISVIHFIIFYFVKGYPFYFSVADAFVYNTLFFFIGLGLWSLVVLTGKEKNKFYRILIYHTISALFIVVVWVFLAEFIRNELVGTNNAVAIDSVSKINRFFMGVLYYSIIVLSYYMVIFYDNLKEKISNEARLETVIREAELKALKSQINPHFLFNSLNSISSLTMSAPSRAQEMIINLSNFLRYSISQRDKHISSLNEEIENCRKYLEIEKIRFGDKLNMVMKIEKDSLTAKVPTMILQPLYENAVKYGVYESSDIITIETICKIRENTLIITIKNNFDPEAIPRKGEGIGLKNIRERLKINYGSENLLRVKKEKNTFEVELYIPQNINT